MARAGAPHYKIVALGKARGFTGIVPTAVNDRGQIIGRMMTADKELHGFLWQDGRFTDLGVGFVNGIDNAGRILFVYHYEGFLWQDGVLLPLGELSADGNEADALNDHGDVAGAVVAGGPFKRAYVWRNGKGHLLPLLLPPSPEPNADWKTDVEKINDQDAVIGRAVPPDSDLQYVYLYQNGKTTLILPKGASKGWPTADIE
ncbi:MAG TPA: hypothetical protein VFW40_07135 [Capsulimonadaceae bacterium]|nr:hypothetical protein [Capsulimonadaceae bacterium]